MRIVAALALAATGCAATPEQQAAQREIAERRFAEAIDGRVPGEPQTCIDLSAVQGPQIIAPDTVIYRENQRRVWVTRSPGCQGLNGDPVIVARVFGTQLCRNDLFQTVPRGGGTVPGPVCRFGDFTPYTRAN